MRTIGTMAIAALALAWAPGCGDAVDDGPDETPPFVPDPIPNAAPVPPLTALVCPTGTLLTYENFGAAFMRKHCTSCHAEGVAERARAGAPAQANFDTAAGVSLWRARILQRTQGEMPSMPPAGSVPEHERKMLAKWLNCGAPVR